RPHADPREDLFLPGAELVISLSGFCVLRRGLGNCRNCRAVVAPAELATIDPHSVQNHGQASGNRDDRSTQPAPRGNRNRGLAGVSKCGDALLRTMLYEAAQVLLVHSRKWSWLKAWGV